MVLLVPLNEYRTETAHQGNAVIDVDRLCPRVLQRSRRLVLTTSKISESAFDLGVYGIEPSFRFLKSMALIVTGLLLRQPCQQLRRRLDATNRS